MPKFWVRTQTTLVNYECIEAADADEALEFGVEDSKKLAYRDYNGVCQTTVGISTKGDTQTIRESTYIDHVD